MERDESSQVFRFTPDEVAAFGLPLAEWQFPQAEQVADTIQAMIRRHTEIDTSAFIAQQDRKAAQVLQQRGMELSDLAQPILAELAQHMGDDDEQWRQYLSPDDNSD